MPDLDEIGLRECRRGRLTDGGPRPFDHPNGRTGRVRRRPVGWVYATAPPGLLPASVALVAAAGETDPAVRRATIDDAVARLIHRRADVKPAERLPQVIVQQAGSRTVRETVEHVLRRVLQRRAVALVPVLGAVASGAASGWLASRVTEAARSAGSLVFLHRHAGVPADILPAGRIRPTSAAGAV